MDAGMEEARLGAAEGGFPIEAALVTPRADSSPPDGIAGSKTGRR